jgi:hypothetical protein
VEALTHLYDLCHANSAAATARPRPQSDGAPDWCADWLGITGNAAWS